MAKSEGTKKTAGKAAAASKGQTENVDQRGRRKVREGVVVSDKMTKTVVVAVSRLEQHPIYKKYIHKTKRYYAHDEREQCGVGDLVKITETRPLSKLKRWKVSEIVRKAEQGLEKIS